MSMGRANNASDGIGASDIDVDYLDASAWDERLRTDAIASERRSDLLGAQE